jgi:hypothetical protein
MIVQQTWHLTGLMPAETCGLPKTISGMTYEWAYGNEAADGRVSDSAVACYPVAPRAASAS